MSHYARGSPTLPQCSIRGLMGPGKNHGYMFNSIILYMYKSIQVDLGKTYQSPNQGLVWDSFSLHSPHFIRKVGGLVVQWFAPTPSGRWHHKRSCYTGPVAEWSRSQWEIDQGDLQKVYKFQVKTFLFDWRKLFFLMKLSSSSGMRFWFRNTKPH